VSLSTTGLDRSAAVAAATSIAAAPADDPQVPVEFQRLPDPVDGNGISYMAPAQPVPLPPSATVLDESSQPVPITEQSPGVTANDRVGVSANVILSWRRYAVGVDLDLLVYGDAPESEITSTTVGGVPARLIGSAASGWTNLLWSPEPGLVMELGIRTGDPLQLVADVTRILPSDAES
jgi:hypothetical protein